MINILSKLIFYFKKPSVIMVIGENKELVIENAFGILKDYFKVGKIQKNPSFLDILKLDVLIFKQEGDQFFLSKSKNPILVITDSVSLESNMEQMLKDLPFSGHVILNFDIQAIREMKSKNQANVLTFGFQQGADFRATDIHLNDVETNFKINYKGNIVPFWLKKTFNKKQIYSVLAAASVGMVLDINLVEISRALKLKT